MFITLMTKDITHQSASLSNFQPSWDNVTKLFFLSHQCSVEIS
jgi:hypothetical protein